MNYKPVDINEIGINHEVLKKLAHCLILLAEGQLQPQERYVVIFFFVVSKNIIGAP